MDWLNKAKVAVELKIHLSDVEPRVWRCIFVPEDTPLDRLHDIIQITMGWQDKHLHRFEFNDVRFTEQPEDSEAEGREEKGISLGIALGCATDRFHYLYDYGDQWWHEIAVGHREEVPPKQRLMLQCVAGSGACPPEDVGGTDGYKALVTALRNPKHPERRQSRQMLGNRFEPDGFDIDAVNAELRKYLRWSRGRE